MLTAEKKVMIGMLNTIQKQKKLNLTEKQIEEIINGAIQTEVSYRQLEAFLQKTFYANNLIREYPVNGIRVQCNLIESQSISKMKVTIAPEVDLIQVSIEGTYSNSAKPIFRFECLVKNSREAFSFLQKKINEIQSD